jgi:hypothetical protein
MRKSNMWIAAAVAVVLAGCSLRLPEIHEAEAECWRACNQAHDACVPKNSNVCDLENSQCINKCPHR